MSAWMRLAWLAAPQRQRIAAALSLSLLACALGVAGPLLGERVLRAAVGSAAISALFIPGLMLLAAAIAQSLATAGNSWLLGGVALDLSRELRRKLYARLQQLPLAWFDRTPTGVILSRVMDDVGVVQGVANGQTLTILIEAGISAGATIWLFTRSWRLGAVVALLAPLYLMIFCVFTRRIRRGSLDVRRQLDGVFAHLKQKIDGILVVRSSGSELREIAAFQEQIHRLHKPRMRVGGLGIAFASLCSGVGSIGAALVFAIGAGEVAAGRLTTGELIAASALAGLIFTPITRLSELATIYQQAAASLERLAEILDAPIAGPVVACATLGASKSPAAGRIEFDDVGFSYLPGQNVLQNISLKVEAGSRIAVVGRTGSGKTTLLSLLLRFYEPTSGTIRLDGTPLAEIPLSELRDRIGIVLQEATVFRGTLAENIGYGTLSATREQIESAGESARLEELAAHLPKGYDTLVGEGGPPLSQGERQRIAIARLLCKNPSIVVLDEATSSLDRSGEIEVQRALATLLAGRTTLTIAHRLATIREADKIVVLECGRIVQAGTHQELLADRSGCYRRLHDSQLPAAKLHSPQPKPQPRQPAALDLQPTAA